MLAATSFLRFPFHKFIFDRKHIFHLADKRQKNGNVSQKVICMSSFDINKFLTEALYMFIPSLKDCLQEFVDRSEGLYLTL